MRSIPTLRKKECRHMDTKRPAIQLALDTISECDCVKIIQECIDYIDIIEIGTPCIKFNGHKVLEQVINISCGKPVLVDLKTMDAGSYEADPFYRMGADICTVLGTASQETIQGVAETAKKHKKRSQVDLINVVDKKEAAQNASNIGIDIIGIHTGIDAQSLGLTPFQDLKEVALLNLGKIISVAGGINQETAPLAIELGADIVVVGGAITGSDQPGRTAACIRQSIH